MLFEQVAVSSRRTRLEKKKEKKKQCSEKYIHVGRVLEYKHTFVYMHFTVEYSTYIQVIGSLCGSSEPRVGKLLIAPHPPPHPIVNWPEDVCRYLPSVRATCLHRVVFFSFDCALKY